MTRAIATLATVLLLQAGPAASQDPDSYRDRVQIRRTSYGVPHILAQDLGALGYA